MKRYGGLLALLAVFLLPACGGTSSPLSRRRVC